MADSLRLRVVTALLLAPLAIAAVLCLPTPWLRAGPAAWCCLLGVSEWTRLIGLRGALAPLALVAANGRGHGRDAGSRGEQHSLHWAAWVGVAWWSLAALWLRHYCVRRGARGAQPRDSRRSPGCWWWCRPGAPPWPCTRQAAHGRGWLLFVVVLVWCADVCAYFAGRRYRRAQAGAADQPGQDPAPACYGALVGERCLRGRSPAPLLGRARRQHWRCWSRWRWSPWWCRSSATCSRA